MRAKIAHGFVCQMMAFIMKIVTIRHFVFVYDMFARALHPNVSLDRPRLVGIDL